MKVLILGVGNILLQDEGMGVHTITRLQQRYRFPQNVELMDGGTAGMELLESVAGNDHLIILDAVHTGQEAGSLVSCQNDEVPALFRKRISPHQLGISDVLAMLTLTGEIPPTLSLFGLVPQKMETGLEMTPMIEDKIDLLVDLTINQLIDMGINPEPIEDADQDSN